MKCKIIGVLYTIDENGEANEDTVVFSGRSTSVDLNGDGTIGTGEKADYTVTQNGFMVCNGIVDASGQCILTTLEGTKTADDPDAITTSQSLTSAGALTINGALNDSGTAKLGGGSGASVKIKSGGDDSGVKFTVTGTDAAGNALTEVITGAKSSTATGTKVFATVTEIKADKAAAGTVEAGVAASVAISEKKITDDQISATLKPTIFSACTKAVAVSVKKGEDINGDGIEDTYEVAGANNGFSMAKAYTGGGAQNLVINGDEASGGAVSLMKSQNVKLTSSGNDSGITFTVTGTGDDKAALTEVITGANAGTAYGLKEFATITEIKASGNTAGTVEAGGSTFYLDVDGDSKADTVTDGKVYKDLNGDGDTKDTGEEITLKSYMGFDEIFECTLTHSVNGTGAGEASIASHQVFDAHEIRPVYEIKNVNTNETDVIAEFEGIEFDDGKVSLISKSKETVTADFTTGITELVNQTGSNFGDEINSSKKNDILTGEGGKDEFVFGNETGTDRITDFIVKDVDSDSDGTVDIHADIIKVLKNVNGQTIETAANVLARVTSTTDGALLNLGTDANGKSHTILFEGINKDNLTVDNFLVLDVI